MIEGKTHDNQGKMCDNQGIKGCTTVRDMQGSLRDEGDW